MALYGSVKRKTRGKFRFANNERSGTDFPKIRKSKISKAANSHPEGVFMFGAQLASVSPNLTQMLEKFIFNRMSARQQVNYLKKKGVILGTRVKDGRRMYIYMLRDLFIEVLYENDNTDREAEKVSILEGLDNLNRYLEKEFKASF